MSGEHPEPTPGARAWVLSTQRLRERDVDALWAAVLREMDRREGPGPFVLGIEGRSGAGKTGMARELMHRAQDLPQAPRGGTAGTDDAGAAGADADGATAEGGVALLRLEEMYPGWHGLAQGVAAYAAVLRSLRRGEPGTWRAWDWNREAPDPPERLVDPTLRLLIVEGVGASAPRHPDVGPDFTAWLYLDEAQRRRRALARDGETYRPWWEVWAAQERELFGLAPARASAARPRHP